MNAALLKDVVKEQIQKGKIVLFSSHQMNYIEEFCQEIAILNQGKIAISGNLEQIKRSYPRDRLTVFSPQYREILSQLGNRCQLVQPGELLLRLDSPSQKQEMMGQLVARYDIDRVQVYEPSLNDIFVEYAGDHV